MKRNALIAIWVSSLTIVVPALAADKPQPAAIQNLIKQTIGELVFVKGGTFMMGDVGC